MKNSILLLFCLCFAANITGQDIKFPALDKSPLDAAHYPNAAAFQNYLEPNDPERNQLIKVLYSRPQKNGRSIFGELIPYGVDYRLGANEATEVTFYQRVEIGNTVIPSGTYTMFAQLFPDQWIVKISSERFIGGAANRDVSKDLVAVTVPVNRVREIKEAFTIGFQKVNNQKVKMVFAWDDVQVELPINLNPPIMDGLDVSPMDLVQFPDRSRLRNYVDEADLAANEPQVRVVYARPTMKGRKIFGELLPNGEVWRVGANETTEITFFKDVTVGGVDIEAGRYGLFSIVDEQEWTFIIHKNVQSWGPTNHDDADNIVKVTAKTERTPTTLEALSMTFAAGGNGKLELLVGWENTMARLPIQVK